MADTKNNVAWQQLFDKHDIVNKVEEEGATYIKASDINEFREARLMTKFDHCSQLPDLFVKHSISILPVSRGSYILGRFDMFHPFEESDAEVIPVTFPSFLESLNHQEISSEATAINCAFVSGILQHFTGEAELYPTVSGRMSSGKLSFEVTAGGGRMAIEVDNSQMEIDGGYEGTNCLALIEAKNYISDDFLIRQLYYPYALWNTKISKQVRPIFLSYSNGIYHVKEYTFDNTSHYNSVRLVEEKRYTVLDSVVNMETIDDVRRRVETVAEPQLPFPQADSFARVINLCELLQQKGFIPKEEITTNYDFDKRQTDYYANAAAYLGLVEKSRDNYGQIGLVLTTEGQRIFSLPVTARQVEFIKAILGHAPFKMTLDLCLRKGAMPSKGEVVEIMKRVGVYGVGEDSTYGRRASTIIGWLNWILGNTTE